MTSVEEILARNGIESDDSLAHYGKLGMKWGRRSGSKSGKSGKSASKEMPRTRHQIKKMTDAQLKHRITRLKMEKEYAQLTAPQVSTGRKIAKRILLEVGETQAKAYLNNQISSGNLTRMMLKAASKSAATATNTKK